MRIRSLPIRFSVYFFMIFCFMLLMNLYGYDAGRNKPFFIPEAIAKSINMSSLFSTVYILQEIRKGFDNNDFKRIRNKVLGLIFLFIWIVTAIYFFFIKQLKLIDTSWLKSVFCGFSYSAFNVLLIYTFDSILNRKKKERK